MLTRIVLGSTLRRSSSTSTLAWIVSPKRVSLGSTVPRASIPDSGKAPSARAVPGSRSGSAVTTPEESPSSPSCASATTPSAVARATTTRPTTGRRCRRLTLRLRSRDASGEGPPTAGTPRGCPPGRSSVTTTGSMSRNRNVSSSDRRALAIVLAARGDLLRPQPDRGHAAASRIAQRHDDPARRPGSSAPRSDPGSRPERCPTDAPSP